MEPGQSPITLLDVVRAKVGDKQGYTGADCDEAGVPLMGGCEVCNASIAVYNACPSKTGYIRCQSGCIGDLGFSSVAEFLTWQDENEQPDVPAIPSASDDDQDGWGYA